MFSDRGYVPLAASNDMVTESVIACPPRQHEGSTEGVDRIRHREAERGDDPDQLTAVLERLGHHRVGQHGEDRSCREG